MDLLQAVNTLEEALQGKKGWLNRKIDIDECINLTKFIKENMIKLVTNADNVIKMKQNILSNADIVAKNTILEAENKAKHLVEISSITAQAQAKGKDIIDEAYAKCDILVQKTKAHLDDLLKETENFITSLLSTITKNRDELRQLQLQVN